MKTFQRVPPQSTENCLHLVLPPARYKPRQTSQSFRSPSQTVTTAKNSAHEWGQSLLPSHMVSPHSSQELQAPGTPSTLQLKAEPQSCGTSSPAPAHKQLYSQKHYYMTNTPVFPNDNIHNSSAPGIHFSRYQVLLHTCCRDLWDQQHQRIHLVTQNKQIIAGLFQVSFGSVLKQHDFSSPGFRKRVWLGA